MKRECGDCTKCCEGWLNGSAKGKSFYPGKPCHYISIGKGCTIYATRPKDPCIDFKCQWLIDSEIAEWLKPNQVNAIILSKEVKGMKYLSLVEAGETLRSDVLTQVLLYAVSNQINFVWAVNNGVSWIGSQEFIEEMALEYQGKKE